MANEQRGRFTSRNFPIDENQGFHRGKTWWWWWLAAWWGRCCFVCKEQVFKNSANFTFFSPVPTPGVLLMKGGYAPTPISIYISMEKVVTSYAPHS